MERWGYEVWRNRERFIGGWTVGWVEKLSEVKRKGKRET